MEEKTTILPEVVVEVPKLEKPNDLGKLPEDIISKDPTFTTGIDRDFVKKSKGKKK